MTCMSMSEENILIFFKNNIDFIEINLLLALWFVAVIARGCSRTQDQ